MGYRKGQLIKKFLKTHGFQAFTFHTNYIAASEHLLGTNRPRAGKRRRAQSFDDPIPNKRRKIASGSSNVRNVEQAPHGRRYVLGVDMSLMITMFHSSMGRRRGREGQTHTLASISGGRFYSRLSSCFIRFLDTVSPVSYIVFAIDGPYCMRPPPKNIDDITRRRPETIVLNEDGKSTYVSKPKPSPMLFSGPEPRAPFTNAQFPSFQYSKEHPEVLLPMLAYITQRLLQTMSEYPLIGFAINQGCRAINPGQYDRCIIHKWPGQQPPTTVLLTTTRTHQVPDVPYPVHVGEGENIIFGEFRHILSQNPPVLEGRGNRVLICLSHDTDIFHYNILQSYRLILSGNTNTSVHILSKHYSTVVDGSPYMTSKRLYSIDVRQLIRRLDHYYHNQVAMLRPQHRNPVLTPLNRHTLRTVAQRGWRRKVRVFPVVLMTLFVALGCDFCPGMGSMAGMSAAEWATTLRANEAFKRYAVAHHGKLPTLSFRMDNIIEQIILRMESHKNPLALLTLADDDDMTVVIDMVALRQCVLRSTKARRPQVWVDKIDSAIRNATWVLNMAANAGSQSHVEEWQDPEYGYRLTNGRCFQTMQISVDEEEEE